MGPRYRQRTTTTAKTTVTKSKGKLPSHLINLFHTLSNLPKECSGLIIGYTFALMDFKAGDLQHFSEYFIHVPRVYVEVELSEDCFTYYLPFSQGLQFPNEIAPTRNHKWIDKLPIKHVIIDGDTFGFFKDEIRRAPMVNYSYNPNIYNIWDMEQALPWEQITRISQKFTNVVPPLSMSQKSPLLQEVRVCINEAFEYYTLLEAVIFTAKRVDIGLHITDPDFFNSKHFKEWVQSDKVNLRVCDAEVRESGQSLEKVKKMKIDHLTMHANFETLSTFKGVKELILEELPPSKYKLRAAKSLKKVECLVSPPVKPINFSFRKLTHIKELVMYANVSKHSFESIPDNVRKLILIGCNVYGNLDMTTCKLPKYLSTIEFQNLFVNELPHLNQCAYLESILFMGVATIVAKNINLRANLEFWKSIPSSVRRLYFDYQDEHLFTQKSMTDVYIDDNLEGIQITVSYRDIGMVFLSRKTLSTPNKILGKRIPHIRFFNGSHDVTMMINKRTPGILYSDKNFNMSKIHFLDLDKYPLDPLKLQGCR
ncbi:unnamed protein product [Ambrosiozyma monospora]|uniref:Unnamed protein product n=1 Tax=Ambrosiozyma monospora TaxID=43982 RepID=A0A9W6YY73_AMBMO|nr:unnamed protein product [Ambrosiozyma monospora]